MNRAARIAQILETIKTNGGWASLANVVAPIQNAYENKGAGFDAALKALTAAERAGLIVRRSKAFGFTNIAGYNITVIAR